MKIAKSISLELEMVEIIDEFVNETNRYKSFSEFVRIALEEKIYNTI